MKLENEFIRLPFRFDVDRLQQEVQQFDETEWRPHPQGFPGNSAIPLVAVRGDPDDDRVRGPHRATPLLQRCPYLQQVLATFECELGRTRLMRLGPDAETTPHVDSNYYWLSRVRIHVPIMTFPDVEFHCGERWINMAAGDCWLFDTWRRHNVINKNPDPRIHLVIDTAGSPLFWDMLHNTGQPYPFTGNTPAPRFVPFVPDTRPELLMEQHNFPVVMSPTEQQKMLDLLFPELESTAGNAPPTIGALRTATNRFLLAWKTLYDRHGIEPEGWPHFESLLGEFKTSLGAAAQNLKFANGTGAEEILLQALVRPALNTDLHPTRPTDYKKKLAEPERHGLKAVRKIPASPASPPPTVPIAGAGNAPKIARPVLIVSAPRSGSSLLFETLARSPDAYTIGGESHGIFESIEDIRPASRNFDSNRLTATDASAATSQQLIAAFTSKLHNHHGRMAKPGETVRMLEKTPKNALRIPFLNAVFPDALFIYLHREPRGNLASIIDGWNSGRFVTYPKLPGWPVTPKWSFLLTPGWRALVGKPTEEIAVQQWVSANQIILDDLAALPPDRWCVVDYEAFLRAPRAEYERLCRFTGLAAGAPWKEALPLSQHTLTPPNPDKWKRHEAVINNVLPQTAPVSARVSTLFAGTAQDRKVAPAGAPAGTAQPPPVDPKAALKSVFTTNLPALFTQLRASLLVTTYQAGKLVIVRVKDGSINTHFRMLPKPMGLDATQSHLAIGTRQELLLMRNVPSICAKIEPPGNYDACFVQRETHVTGDIDIHEMAFGLNNQLWVINTRFGCLCTLDQDHSFVPRWRPPFLTALAPEDRCHLNGLALVDGQPRYVTALGETDTQGGWRENKASGGILMDITTNQVILRGLSMPHSPRWYRDRLWLLESGKGGLGYLDAATGKVVTVAQLPGFTRGLDFIGPLAFVGLSQVRETAVFAGLPLTETLKERICGVWVVNIETGKTVGFIRFEGAVQELFAVKVLRGMQFPEVLDPADKLTASSYVLPDAALADVPRERLGSDTLARTKAG